jgi:hypothetical protein
MSRSRDFGAAASSLAAPSSANNGYAHVVDTTQSSGWNFAGNQAAGKNAIINGGMDWFQRSTSVTIPNTTPGYYAPDRFLFYSNGGSTTLSRVAGTAGITYATQVATTSGNTQINIENRLEYQSAQLLMGKTVTFSFYVNVATTSGVAIAVGDYYPSSLDNWASVTFAQKGTVSAGQLSAGNWARQSITFIADSNTTGLGFYLTITGLGANTLQITGLQVEIGSVATPFSRAGGTLSGELAACQRYYQQLSGVQYNVIGQVATIETTFAAGTIYFPVAMRTQPTFAKTGTQYLYINGTLYYPTTTLLDSGNTFIILQYTTSGMTRGQSGNVLGLTAFTLQFSSEL